MQRVYLLLALAACGASVVHAETPMTDAEKKQILNDHIVLREGEGASNMQKMEWDDTLAQMAQDWGDSCKWYHGQPEGYDLTEDDLGQNLWYSTSSKRLSNVSVASQAWFDEKRFYTYDTQACSAVCGHYTQLVWAKSSKLGCGYGMCTELFEEGGAQMSGITSAQYIVCNYSPPGNYPTHPFLKGPPCTACDSGYFTCQNGVCLGVEYSACEPDCTCEGSCKNGGTLGADCKCYCAAGWRGITCADECANKEDNCGAYPLENCEEDNEFYAWFIKNCPEVCKLCGGTYDGEVFVYPKIDASVSNDTSKSNDTSSTSAPKKPNDGTDKTDDTDDTSSAPPTHVVGACILLLITVAIFSQQ